MATALRCLVTDNLNERFMTNEKIIELLYDVFEEQRKFHHNNDWDKQESSCAGAEEIMLREMGRIGTLIVKLEREA